MFGEKSNLPDFRKHGQSLAVAAVAVIVVVVEVVEAAAAGVAVLLVAVASLHDRIIIQYCKSMPITIKIKQTTLIIN